MRANEPTAFSIEKLEENYKWFLIEQKIRNINNNASRTVFLFCMRATETSGEAMDKLLQRHCTRLVRVKDCK